MYGLLHELYMLGTEPWNVAYGKMLAQARTFFLKTLHIPAIFGNISLQLNTLVIWSPKLLE